MPSVSKAEGEGDFERRPGATGGTCQETRRSSSAPAWPAHKSRAVDEVGHHLVTVQHGAGDAFHRLVGVSFRLHLDVVESAAVPAHGGTDGDRGNRAIARKQPRQTFESAGRRQTTD